MILLRRRSWDALLVVIAVLTIISIVYHHRTHIANDFFQQFPPSGFGYSSREQIEVQCAQGCTDVITKGITHSIFSAFSDGRPESLTAHIGFSQMQSLLHDQKTAITTGTLIDPGEVSGKLEYRGQMYPVKFRLKGDLKDHWSEPGRMSLKVSVRKGRTIMGFSSFSLHRPASRQHPYEPAFEDFVRLTGGLAARHKYAQLSVNGENWGIWNVEERVSPELLEKQQRKDSLIFDVSQEIFWNYVRSSPHPYVDPGYRLKDAHLFADSFRKNQIRKSLDFRRQYSYVLQQLLIDGGDHSYDWPAMTRSILLAYIWGTNHVLLGGNTRYYLNPYTLRLVPITSDQSWPLPVETSGLVYPYPMPYRRFIESDRFKSLYPAALREIIKQESRLDSIFWDYFELFPNDSVFPLNVVHQNIFRATEFGYQEIIQQHKSLPTDRFVYVDNPAAATELNQNQREHLQAHVHVRHFTDGTVRIRNLLDTPVRLLEVRAEDGLLWEDLPLIPAKSKIDLSTEFFGIRDHEVQVTTQLNDFRLSQNADLTLFPLASLKNPLLNSIDPTTIHPFLLHQDGGYRIPAGQWRVDQALIIQGNLEIAAGTTLSFAPDSYLIVHGALSALGEASAPIRMQGAATRWKGLYVYEAPTVSQWRHLQIDGTSEVQSGPLRLSGGINLYKSDLQADQITITDASGEDALNIVESSIQLTNIKVYGSRSDAIDLDFCVGSVNKLNITLAGGDGLDLSGTTLHMEEFTATEIHDKALSAGEASDVTLNGAKLQSVGVGIAAKDGSTIRAKDILISEVTLHPLMSYSKKDFFSAPSLSVTNIQHPEDKAIIRQRGAMLTVNGQSPRETELDVDALYRGEVMAK